MTQNSDRGSKLCKHSCLEVSKIPSTSRTQFIMEFHNLDIFLFLILKPNLELVCSRENFVNLLHNTIINLTNIYVLKDQVIIKWDRSFCNLLWIFFLLLRSCHFCLCCWNPSLFRILWWSKKFANVGWLANSYWSRKNSATFLAMIFKKTLVHPPSI